MNKVAEFKKYVGIIDAVCNGFIIILGIALSCIGVYLGTEMAVVGVISAVVICSILAFMKVVILGISYTTIAIAENTEIKTVSHIDTRTPVEPIGDMDIPLREKQSA